MAYENLVRKVRSDFHDYNDDDFLYEETSPAEDITVTNPTDEPWTAEETTPDPQEEAMEELEEKLYHMKLWTILLIAAVGLMLFLASLWIGRKAVTRVQRMGIMRPSRMRDIWDNVHVINFRPGILFRRSSTDLRRHKNEDSPMMQSLSSISEVPTEERPKRSHRAPPLFSEVPIHDQRRQRSFSDKQRRSVPSDKLMVANPKRKRSSSESSTGRMKFAPHYDSEDDQIVYKIVST